MKYYLCIFLIMLSLVSFALETKEDIKKEIEENTEEVVKKKKKKNRKAKKKKSKTKKTSSKSSSSSSKTNKTGTNPVDSQQVSKNTTIFDYLSYVFIPSKEDSSNYVLRNMLILSTRYNFQHWKPTFIEGTEISTTTLSYTEFEVFVYKKLFHVRYEKSFGEDSSNEQTELLNKRDKDRWVKLLADVTIPFKSDVTIPLRIGLNFSYIQETFTGAVIANEDKTYVTEDYDSEAEDISYFEFLEGEKIDFETDFKDFLLGGTISGKNGAFMLGGFYTRYEKPYSLTMDNEQNSKYIFDSRFTGGGIFSRIRLFNSRTSFDLNGKFGFGSIYLLGIDLKVGENIDNSFVTYTDIDAKLLMTENILRDFVSLQAGFDIRYRRFDLFFSDTGKDDEVEDKGHIPDSILLNSDTIYTGKLGISLNF